MARSKEFATSSKSLMLIAFVLAMAGLYFGRKVFIPVALALVFSFLLSPFVTFLEKIRFGRVPAVLTILVLTLALFGLATWGVAGQLVQIMVQLPDYKENLDAKIRSLHSSKTGDFGKATATVQELNKELAAVPGEISGRAQAKEPGTAHPGRPIPVQVATPTSNLMQDLGALLGPLSEPLETAVIVIIFTMFMLVKREDLRNRAIRLAGRGQLSRMTQALDDASRRLSRYLLLQFLVNAGYGALFGLALYFIGVPHPLLWGAVAAVLRFVPYVGTFIAAALPVAMAIAVFPGWRQAGLAFGAFVALELIVANLLEPLLYGAHTGISSLAILVAAVFWATLWGPVGLILSTPLTLCLVVLGRYVPQLNFLEVVLGDEPVLPPEQAFYQRLLSLDEEEARGIAEANFKEHKIESFYDSFLIPALRLAEQDHYMEALDDETRKFVLRSARDLIEDIGDRLTEEPSDKNTGKDGKDQQSLEIAERPMMPGAGANVACMPLRTGPDELITMMMVQLLQHEGYGARQMQAVSPEEVLAELSQDESTVVCVSCLPPFAVASARSVCKRLRIGLPKLQIVMGTWTLEGGSTMARERLGPGCQGSIAITLAEALAEIQRLTNSPADARAVAEKEKAQEFVGASNNEAGAAGARSAEASHEDWGEVRR